MIMFVEVAAFAAIVWVLMFALFMNHIATGHGKTQIYDDDTEQPKIPNKKWQRRQA
jgi:hypothetical protein